MENTVYADTILQEKKTNISPVGQDAPHKSTSTGTPISEEVASTSTDIPVHEDEAVSATAELPENVKMQLEAEQKISTNVMSICLTSDGLVIKDEERAEPGEVTTRLSGVYCEGVQYYDLNDVQYINNTGMAILIDLLKSLLEMGVEVQFVNVHDSIKKKIREMGLEKIINYGQNSAS